MWFHQNFPLPTNIPVSVDVKPAVGLSTTESPVALVIEMDPEKSQGLFPKPELGAAWNQLNMTRSEAKVLARRLMLAAEGE